MDDEHGLACVHHRSAWADCCRGCDSDSRPLLRTDWNLQSRLYEAKRHDYDNATPPAIPQLLTEACRRGLDLIRSHPECADAIPDTEHDACIVNFYPVDDVRIGSKVGRLGVHQVSVVASQRLFSVTSERVYMYSQCVRQDLDEAPEVIARGDPIVSLSVGAAADFAYGPTRFDFDEDGQPQATEAPEEGVAPPTTVRLESGDLLVFGGSPHDHCQHLGCILPRVAFRNGRADREVAAGISRCGGLRPGADAKLAAHGAGAAELHVQEHGARDGGADARLNATERSERCWLALSGFVNRVAFALSSNKYTWASDPLQSV